MAATEYGARGDSGGSATRKELERLLAECTAELDRTTADLQAAGRTMAAHESARLMFVENASHELRTPLATMSYATGNLLQGIAGPLPERVREYLEMFKEECQRMVATVTRMLDLSRIDAATVELRRMKVPLGRFTHSVVDRVREETRDHSLSLVLLPSDAAAGFVLVDPLRFDHVVRSVLGNAIEFTPDTGRIEVTVRPIRESTWLEVTVTDDGPGVPAEDLPRLAERYYRVGDFVKGMGLGLAFCKEILGLHGGELQVVSPPPERSNGTQVSIRLVRCIEDATYGKSYLQG